MFTVTHEKPDGTKEFYSVHRPEFVPKADRTPPHLNCDDLYTLEGGRVFIMNAQGSTVARFDL